MLPRQPLDRVVLALKKAGGAADADQLAATTGLSRSTVLRRLRALQGEGLVLEAAGVWQLGAVA